VAKGVLAFLGIKITQLILNTGAQGKKWDSINIAYHFLGKKSYKNML